MTTTYGLTPTGFNAPTLDVVIESFLTPLRARFGTSLDFSSASTEGIVVGVLANAVMELWEVLQAIVSGMDPDAATGFLLRAICAFTGVFEKPTTASSVTETLTGDPTTVVPQDSQVRTTSTLSVFRVTADTALVALDAWVILTAYTLGDRRTNAGRTYICITAGTSAASGGPSTTSADITDGTVHWRYMGDGTAAADVLAVCIVDGPTIAVSGDLNDIVTPIVGLSGAINLADADLGRPVMSDQELRVFREQEIAAPGNGTADAIYADLLDLPNVTAVTVFVNTTETTNVDGMPPHSVEALVTGGDDEAIAASIWASADVAAATAGNTSADTLDAAGVTQTIYFSRPVDEDIYVRLALAIFAAPTTLVPAIVPVYPADGSDQVKAAVVAFGDLQPVGSDARAGSLGGQSYSVDGVLEVLEALVWTAALVPGGQAAVAAATAWAASTAYVAGDVRTNDGRTYVCITSGTSAGSGGPSTTAAVIADNSAEWRWLGAPVVITSRQRAVYDTSRIVVTTTNSTP